MEPEYLKLKDIKSTLSGYIRDAGMMLSHQDFPDEKTIHDIRVLMKRSRASLKLLKPQIDSDIFRKEYETFRDTGRMMRKWREGSVHRKTLKNLGRKYPELFNLLSGNDQIMNMMRKEGNSSDTETEKSDLDKIKGMLYKSGFRIRFHNLRTLEPNLLLSELEKSYITVTDCFLSARNSLKPSSIHEFRKRSKDFLYQLCFFRSIKPKVIKELEKRIDSMTQNLGKYNDLVVLLNELGYDYKTGKNDYNLDELAVLIRFEQDKYLSRVWPDAYKIFCPGRKLANVMGFKLLTI